MGREKARPNRRGSRKRSLRPEASRKTRCSWSLGRRGPGGQGQAAAHPQVEDEGRGPFEIDQQVLGPPPKPLDPPAGDVAGQLAGGRAARAGRARAPPRPRSGRPPDDARGCGGGPRPRAARASAESTPVPSRTRRRDRPSQAARAGRKQSGVNRAVKPLDKRRVVGENKAYERHRPSRAAAPPLLPLPPTAAATGRAGGSGRSPVGRDPTGDLRLAADLGRSIAGTPVADGHPVEYYEVGVVEILNRPAGRRAPPSSGRSTPTAAASWPVPTATPATPTASSGSPAGGTSRPASSSSAGRRRRSDAGCATRRSPAGRSQSAPPPTPTSRPKSGSGSPARCWRPSRAPRWETA